MKKQKALRNSPWDMAAFCFGCAVAGFSLLFAVLLITGSMLLFHPAASLVFAALELSLIHIFLVGSQYKRTVPGSMQVDVQEGRRKRGILRRPFPSASVELMRMDAPGCSGVSGKAAFYLSLIHI